jgi:hypothetical protein
MDPSRSKTGFGLPVTILKKLLHAPSLSHIGDSHDEQGDNYRNNLEDRNDLFLSSTEMSDLGIHRR